MSPIINHNQQYGTIDKFLMVIDALRLPMSAGAGIDHFLEIARIAGRGSMSKEVLGLQYLRGAAAMLVVLHHWDATQAGGCRRGRRLLPS